MSKIIVALLFLLPAFGFAQKSSVTFDLDPFKDRNRQIKDALLPGIQLIKEKFALVDKDGNSFGANDHDYFGITYHVGAITSGVVLLPKMAAVPGAGDSALAEYKEQYTAKITSVEMRPFTDSAAFVEVPATGYDFGAVPFIPKPDAVDQFTLHDYKDVSEGKLLLFYYDKGDNIEKITPKISVVQVNSLKWDENGYAEYKDMKPSNAVIIGGVLFNETVSFAKLTYDLVGYYELADNKWQLVAAQPPLKKTITPLKPGDDKKKK